MRNRLTGTSPFQGKSLHEVIAKNRECNIVFAESQWENVSPEGRDLAKQMLAKNPEDRISAKSALNHPWFTLENISASFLSSAQENMKKYNDENRFNVEKIKPEFSMITCSPMFSLNKSALSPHSPHQFTQEKLSSPLNFQLPSTDVYHQHHHIIFRLTAILYLRRNEYIQEKRVRTF